MSFTAFTVNMHKKEKCFLGGTDTFWCPFFIKELKLTENTMKCGSLSLCGPVMDW